jgi:hypothetical protein
VFGLLDFLFNKQSQWVLDFGCSVLDIYNCLTKKKNNNNPGNECENYPPSTSYLFNLCRKAHI